ncbi:uroporphyrinogen-III synthase [Colwellia sp. D2M02]|uniref:uroporphyrinogen-III synthase n=1 Tax=Colwellia sp. D2M02 TaxID=2841562 RepID=UPI001C081CBF|nr:uroporphyrinogen-III synthase [Colwellia sp. D2M02]MBU2893497.1 uroporphyrinogen-III synthase [Colwellia sp. D2M02]
MLPTIVTTELTVLLTRPQEKSEQLAAQLQTVNIGSFIQPLFDYKASATTADINAVMADVDIVIFVSAPAVAYTDACYPLTSVLTLTNNSIQFFAVGQATQVALERLGIENVLSPQAPLAETSEGLLQLPELQNVANKKVVIFRGNGGREHIANTLTARGADLHYIESYQRVWKTLSQKQLTRWKSNKINCIVATSNDILTTLVKLIDDNDEQNNFWREQCVWVVVSQRIADNAKHLGLRQVINSQGANSQKICDALKQLQKNTM